MDIKISAGLMHPIQSVKLTKADKIDLYDMCIVFEHQSDAPGVRLTIEGLSHDDISMIYRATD
jgi:hypothetical protein